jgi:NADPH:quinone reductase
VTIRAAMCRSYGGPEVVQIEDIEPPALGPGLVRVRVGAAAVNFPDVLVIANEYQVKCPLPFVPGSEYAGEITELGDGVDAFKVGDRVFGSAFVGAFSEEIVASAASMALIPPGVDLEVAAAFGVAHRTSYHVLRSVAELKPGEELVVLGAGGGVGLAAVQLGAIMGASVTAVASSPEKLEAARACGATTFINYRDGDLRQALREALPGGSDVVVDPVGGDLSEPALRSLHNGGRFVTVGYAAGSIPRIPLNLVLLKGIAILGFDFRSFATHHSDEMVRNDQELMELLSSGQVTPFVEARFDFDEAAAALQHVADGKAIGKVLLRVGDES